jgi:hypothetical protein
LFLRSSVMASSSEAISKSRILALHWDIMHDIVEGEKGEETDTTAKLLCLSKVTGCTAKVVLKDETFRCYLCFNASDYTHK